jgi:hypothetical protein
LGAAFFFFFFAFFFRLFFFAARFLAIDKSPFLRRPLGEENLFPFRAAIQET